MDAKNDLPMGFQPVQRKRFGFMLIAFLSLIILSSLRVLFLDHPGLSLDLNHRPTYSPPKKVAVIIEDRPLAKLAPLLLHFSSVLGPTWPVILFTTVGNGVNSTSAPLRRAIDEGRISVQYLPPDVRFTNQAQIAEFMTLPWLWQNLAPAEHVLTFQADSILCANSPLRVDDFLQYDFVGAPIDPTLGKGEGYNGGLSLRNRSMMLDIVTKASWYSERRHAKDPREPSVIFEDQWVYKKMTELPVYPDGRPGARLPPIDIAKTFSVESIWYDTPLGYQQVGKWQDDEMDKVNQWCPEHRISTTELVLRDTAFD